MANNNEWKLKINKANIKVWKKVNGQFILSIGLNPITHNWDVKLVIREQPVILESSRDRTTALNRANEIMELN